MLPVGVGPVQFWDGAGPHGDGVVNGGTSNWNNFVNTNWTDATGVPVQAWQNGTAMFGGTAGIATITETVNAQSLVFTVSGYNINASGGNTLNLVDATPAQPTINVVGGIATINAQITGNQGFNANGTGTLILTNTGNSFTGGILVTNTGTVSVAADGALGGAGSGITLNAGGLQATATFTLAAARIVTLGAGGGTIDVTGPDTLTIGGVNQITGVGSLTKIGTGTLLLTGANNYTGATNINGGTVSISQDANLGTAPGAATAGHLTFNGGTLLTTASFTLNANRGTTLDAGGGTLNVQAGTTLTYGGIIAGAGALTKNSAGLLILTGKSTYANTTTINGGTLQVGDGVTVGAEIGSNTAGAAFQVNVNNGTTLDVRLINGGAFNNDIVTAGNGAVHSNTAAGVTQTFAGVISGTGTVDVFGLAGVTSGITILSGANTYTGITTVNQGTLRISNATALGAVGGLASGTVVVNGATLDLNGQTVGAEELSIAGVGVGGPANNTGALVNSNAAAASLGGVVHLTGNTTVNTNAGNITLSGNIDGGFGLTKNGTNATGTLTLTGVNTYTGLTTVATGILQVGNNSALGSVNTGTTVANGASLQLLNNITTVNEPLTIVGAGAGPLAPGALTILGGGGVVATYTGNIIVDPTNIAGGATINANGGTLNLTGTITKNNVNLTLAGIGGPGSVINVNNAIQGNLPGFNSDLIVNGTTANLNFANTYLGPTFIRSIVAGDGVLNANVANALPTANGRTSVRMDNLGAGTSTLNIGGSAGFPLGASQAIASLQSADPTSKVTLGLNTLTIGFGSGLNVNGTANANFAGVISDTQGVNSANVSLIKDDTSTQILSGVNTYNGATQVNGGILSLQNGAAIVDTNKVIVTAPGTLNLLNSEVIGSLAGSGFVTLNANLLTTGGNGNTTLYSGVMSGNGAASLIKTGGGTMTLSGANTFTGTAVVNNGVLQLQNGAAIADVVAVTVTAPGSMDLLNSEVIGSLAGTGNVTLNANLLTTGGNNGTTTYSGVMSGNGAASLVKNGTGTMTLSGANTFTGTAVVNDGTLSLQGGAAIADTVAVTVNNPAGVPFGILNLVTSETIGSLAGAGNVTLNARTLTTGGNGNTTTFSGVMSGAGGGLTKNGGGTFTLSGQNTYTGATLVNAGTLLAGSTQAFGINSATTVAGGAFLDLAGNSNSIGSLADVAGVGGTVQSTVGPATLTMGGDGTSTSFFGTVQDGVGPLSLVKNGGGTQTLGGVNTYTGTTTVNAGTLLAGSGTAFGVNSATTVNAGGTLDLNGFSNSIGSLAGTAGGTVQSIFGPATLTTGGDNTSTAYAGLVQDGVGPLAFVKNGTGFQTLSGANTYTGGTTLNAGTLGAGSGTAFGNGNLTVTGGTLQTVGGPRVVNIGVGNVVFTGGTVIANVGGILPGVNHDQLLTTGNFGAIGGTLALVQTGGYLLAPGDKVNLASAAGGVAGGTAIGVAVPGANITGLAAFSNTPLLVPTVNLYLTTVTLEAMQGSFAALNGGTFNGIRIAFTPNQLSVARGLDSVARTINNKTGIFAEFNFLDTQSLTTLPSNLDKIAPEELASIFSTSFSLANIQSANIQRRTDDIRSGAGVGARMSFPVSAPGYSGSMEGPVGHRSKEIRPPSDERWGTFLTGTGEFTRVGSTTNAAGYRLETGGVTAGIDYRVNTNFAIGMSLGYAGTTASLVNGGKIDADGGRLGIYGTYFTENFYVDAAVTGGLNSYKTRRTTPNNTAAIGSPDGSEVNILIAAGRDWKFGGLTVGPTASYQYTNVRMDGFTETGTFAPLRVAGQTAESSRTSLGVRAYYDAHVRGIVIRPEARLAWQHEFGDNGFSITSNFATLGGNAFTVNGPVTGRDSLLMSAGVTILWNERFATYVNYDGEVGRTNYESHSISGGVRLRF